MDEYTSTPFISCVHSHYAVTTTATQLIVIHDILQWISIPTTIIIPIKSLSIPIMSISSDLPKSITQVTCLNQSSLILGTVIKSE